MSYFPEKICNKCGFKGESSLFQFYTRTCKKCWKAERAIHMRKYRMKPKNQKYRKDYQSTSKYKESRKPRDSKYRENERNEKAFFQQLALTQGA